MLEIKNTEVFGLNRSLVASGNPMVLGEIQTAGYDECPLIPTILERGKNLGSSKTGSGHDNFLSGIQVIFDIKYPLYWSPEFQRYHFAQIVSSQSTMHRLTVAAGSSDFDNMFNKYVNPQIIDIIKGYAKDYNLLQEFIYSDEDGLFCRQYEKPRLTKKELEKLKYEAFMKLRSNLPSGYEMWMTVTTNYLQLKTIYNQRKNHKLKEDWGSFRTWCESLPSFLELSTKKEEL
jgi:hypothetical protein